VSTTNVRNPLFARIFPVCARMMEPEVGHHRSDLVAGLRGRVLELGAGSGLTFAHYPSTVETVVAVEPEPYLRGKAIEAAEQAPVHVEVVDAVAGDLPFPDASFDAGVCSLVLCTVPDQAVALAQLRRVLRPGAELRFFEHVRDASPRKARVQEAFDRCGLWPRVAGGCHCARDTRASLAAGGFVVERAREVEVGPRWGLTSLHLLGSARAA